MKYGSDLSFSNFAEKLARNLQNKLPGDVAHARMAANSKLRLLARPNIRTRKSAVLILFYPYQQTIYLPLILRPPYDGVHSGQMAFPGGRYELTDENLIRTALREAQEEIGLRLTDVSVLGSMTEIFIPPSNFFVLPVVAVMPYKPDFFPDPREVEAIIEVRLTDLLDPAIIGSSQLLIRGDTIDAPHYMIEQYQVWGATAMMISELIDIIGTD